MTVDAFFRYETAIVPRPNATAWMTASGFSATTSRQGSPSGSLALMATNRPLGAPFVVCTKRVPSTTVPNACPSSPTVTVVVESLPVRRKSSKFATHRSFDLASLQ